jgi:hypothetical protein
VLVEEPAVPSTHVMIADHPPLANSDRPQVFEAIHEPIFIDPVWKRPMLLWNNFVIAFCRSEVPCTSFELFREWFIVEKYPWVLDNVRSSMALR